MSNGKLIDVLHISEDELRRKADAIAHAALSIVREAVVLAGCWDRPTAVTPVMELEEYAWLLDNFYRRLCSACWSIERLRIPEPVWPEVDKTEPAYR